MGFCCFLSYPVLMKYAVLPAISYPALNFCAAIFKDGETVKAFDLLFQFWYLITAAIRFCLTITLIVLFDRLSCLDRLRNKLQKLEKK